ncbi:MAG: glycosyltransferase family 2 protein [Acidobacteria bacterium]|nr:glycosyltransferase family 2 protein [Acidobacteriota bacterium]
MHSLSFTFCTYNRADRLEKLVSAMRSQECSIPFEILVINNNSTDHSAEILEKLAQMPGPVLRWVNEPVQGIVSARNRAIAESFHNDVMIFVDDDEIPLPGLLQSAVDCIVKDGAQCVGGRVKIDFSTVLRPKWLTDNLLGFLAEVDYGPEAFWIKDDSTPVWTANVAYHMELFRQNPQLRFDKNYDRLGKGIGGGSDKRMFLSLLKQGARIRYCPQMAVLHDVEPWRLARSYFLKLHYLDGLRRGQFEMHDYPRTIFGFPPFLAAHLIRDSIRTIGKLAINRPELIRQAMTMCHTWGLIRGYRKRSFMTIRQKT